MYPTPVAPVPAARVHPGAEKHGCDVRNVRITQTMRCQSSSQTFCSLPVKHCAVQLQSNKCFPWCETSGVHRKPSKRPSLCVKIKEMKNSLSVSLSLSLSLSLSVSHSVWPLQSLSGFIYVVVVIIILLIVIFIFTDAVFVYILL